MEELRNSTENNSMMQVTMIMFVVFIALIISASKASVSMKYSDDTPTVNYPVYSKSTATTNILSCGFHTFVILVFFYHYYL